MNLNDKLTAIGYELQETPDGAEIITNEREIVANIICNENETKFIFDKRHRDLGELLKGHYEEESE